MASLTISTASYRIGVMEYRSMVKMEKQNEMQESSSYVTDSIKYH